MRRPRRGNEKKFDTVRVVLKDGTAYLFDVYAGSATGYGPRSVFSIALPWGTRVEDKTIDGLLDKARAEAELNGRLQKEKVLCISVGDWTMSANDADKQASLSLAYKVLLRAKRTDGQEVWFDPETGDRLYAEHWDATIPWSAAAELAIENAVKMLHTIHDQVEKVINSTELKNRLESRGLLMLPAGESKETK